MTRSIELVCLFWVFFYRFFFFLYHEAILIHGSPLDVMDKTSRLIPGNEALCRVQRTKSLRLSRVLEGYGEGSIRA